MSTTAVQVWDFDAHKVRLGRLAWTSIKASAEEQRELWRRVGEALLVGKKKHNRNPGELFTEWCVRMGFDMDATTREDTMWFAKEKPDMSGNLMTHPTHMRKWFNENRKALTLPQELAEVTQDSTPTIEVTPRAAERIAKTAIRAKGDDEGAEIAKRHMKVIAETYGVTTEKLEDRSAASNACM